MCDSDRQRNDGHDGVESIQLVQAEVLFNEPGTGCNDDARQKPSIGYNPKKWRTCGKEAPIPEGYCGDKHREKNISGNNQHAHQFSVHWRTLFSSAGFGGQMQAAFLFGRNASLVSIL